MNGELNTTSFNNMFVMFQVATVVVQQFKSSSSGSSLKNSFIDIAIGMIHSET